MVSGCVRQRVAFGNRLCSRREPVSFPGHGFLADGVVQDAFVEVAVGEGAQDGAGVVLGLEQATERQRR